MSVPYLLKIFNFCVLAPSDMLEDVLEAELYPFLVSQVCQIGFPKQLHRKLFLPKQTRVHLVLLYPHLLSCLQLFFFLQ